MSFTLDDIVTLVRLVQLANDCLPIIVSLFGKVMLVSEEQSENAPLSIHVTVLGSSTLERDVQL